MRQGKMLLAQEPVSGASRLADDIFIASSLEIQVFESTLILFSFKVKFGFLGFYLTWPLRRVSSRLSSWNPEHLARIHQDYRLLLEACPNWNLGESR